MWTAWLRSLGEDGLPVHLEDPADETTIAAAEQALGRPLPDDLRSLLCESDGVEDGYGTDVVWSAERIAAENAWLRDPGIDVAERLLVFGETENGELFGCQPRGPTPDVYLVHNDGSRRWVASDLQSLLEQWFARELER